VLFLPKNPFSQLSWPLLSAKIFFTFRKNILHFPQKYSPLSAKILFPFCGGFVLVFRALFQRQRNGKRDKKALK